MTNKDILIHKIYSAFEHVKLEDGIGLWEAQGEDDRLSVEECRKLRLKDEKEDWRKIPLIDLYRCSSSLSFFDAKGMRFHLPMFLLFHLDVFEKEEDELFEQGLTEGCSAPDVLYDLLVAVDLPEDATDDIVKQKEYSFKKRFSVLNTEQIDCVLLFIKYEIEEYIKYYNNIKADRKSSLGVKFDEYYIKLERGIEFWEKVKITANTV